MKQLCVLATPPCNPDNTNARHERAMFRPKFIFGHRERSTEMANNRSLGRRASAHLVADKRLVCALGVGGHASLLNLDARNEGMSSMCSKISSMKQIECG